jgi:uncharacterized RDD family membrane protein YckC
MIDTLSLPASITVGPTSVGVSVLTADGAIVSINLQRLRGLADLAPEKMAERVQALALDALAAAAASLSH